MRDEAVLKTLTSGSRNQYGEWVSGSTSARTIPCTTYPATHGDERVLSESGIRTDGMRIFMTPETVTVPQGTTDDTTIVWDSLNWLVVKVENWITHRKVYTVLEESGD